MESNDGDTTPPARLPFPPLTTSHILHCSYHYWHPLYRSLTPKARLIPLSDAFIDYLRSDGILLPPEDAPLHNDSDDDSGIFSAEDEAGYDSDEEEDPSANWRDIHASIKQTIAELGSKVVPKLNWSAPKDATWINATNSMDCRTPNDVYLLLKSSDFITHDLDHVFDDCVEDTKDDVHNIEATKIPYHLVLRKHILINPAVEFRCFVRKRKLLGVCQRDLNHFDFLQNMRGSLLARIEKFFDDKLKDTFPDESFAFDVYIPPPHDRVWLVDINPWALRTDPILFSWLELLTMPDFSDEAFQKVRGFVRLSLNGANASTDASGEEQEESESEGASDVEEVDEVLPAQPEFRLIKRDDPEAFSFSTQQYSAHKLPKDVVDASQGGPGPMRELADNWKEMLARQRQQQDEEDSSEG